MSCEDNTVLIRNTLPESALLQQQQQQQQRQQRPSPLPLPRKAAEGLSVSNLNSNINSVKQPPTMAETSFYASALSVANDDSIHFPDGQEGGGREEVSHQTDLWEEESTPNSVANLEESAESVVESVLETLGDTTDDIDELYCADSDNDLSTYFGDQLHQEWGSVKCNSGITDDDRVDGDRASQDIDEVTQLIMELENQSGGWETRRPIPIVPITRLRVTQSTNCELPSQPPPPLSFSSMAALLAQSQALASSVLVRAQPVVPAPVVGVTRGAAEVGCTVATARGFDGHSGCTGTKKRRLRRNKYGVIPVPNEAKRKVALARKRVGGRFVKQRCSGHTTVV